MWFVSKKKYDAMVAERDKWDDIASEAVTQNGRLLTQIDGAIKEMKEIQELNHQLVEHNDVLLAYTKELEKQRDELFARVEGLEAELRGARRGNQQWVEDFEELELAYGRLETDYDRLREELDHYEERCRYLEDELLHYQEEEEAEWLARRDAE